MSTIVFEKSDERCETRLAQFLAVIIKEGLTYKVKQDNFAYEVTLTGGF